MLTLFILLCGFSFAGDEAPAWLKQAAATPPAIYPKEAKAVVLHKEQRITVEEDGRITETTFRAVRILTREGRREAHAGVSYNTESGKVKELKAWLIRPTGEVKVYGKQQTVEVAEVDNDIYNEHKIRLIDASDARA